MKQTRLLCVVKSAWLYGAHSKPSSENSSSHEQVIELKSTFLISKGKRIRITHDLTYALIPEVYFFKDSDMASYTKSKSEERHQNQTYSLRPTSLNIHKSVFTEYLIHKLCTEHNVTFIPITSEGKNKTGPLLMILALWSLSDIHVESRLNKSSCFNQVWHLTKFFNLYKTGWKSKALRKTLRTQSPSEGEKPSTSFSQFLCS